ncbi:MAG TPA: ATP synthase subunit I [Candidatus Acidoferrales bacterium]|jgi:small-conductance mechanosensitive channel|nr:ATP synthase subunit I [Candidatus Acidoferrales bacterium]
METSEAAQYELTERRIAWLTLVVGAMAAVGASFLFTIRIGAGVLIGAVLAWINFRWLGNALDAVTRSSIAQEGSPQARVPVLSYLGMIARYALIAGVVYVIFSRLQIPILSMLVGLCALGVAAISATVWEVVSPPGRRNE